MHDAVLDAQRLERGTALLVLVGLVGIDRAFVAADQPVGDGTFIDIGRGETVVADEAGALVDGEMGLVAEMALAGALGPGRVRIAGRALAGRPRRRRCHRSVHQRGIDQCAAFQNEAALGELTVHLAKQRVRQSLPGQSAAKAADRGLIGDRLIERQAKKAAEAQAVGQRLLELTIGQAIPLRQQQRLEHDQRRIRRPSFRGGMDRRQQSRKARPVEQPCNPVKPFVLPRALRHHRVCEAHLSQPTMRHLAPLSIPRRLNQITPVMHRSPEGTADPRTPSS